MPIAVAKGVVMPREAMRLRAPGQRLVDAQLICAGRIFLKSRVP
jgi:hypothetical protein